MFVKSTRFKQVCQLLLSLIVATVILSFLRLKPLNADPDDKIFSFRYPV